jgi:hypothetical protein
MKNLNIVVIGVAVLFACYSFVLLIPNESKPLVLLSREQTNTLVVENDSLQNIIDSLQIDLESQARGFDQKEHRYEEVIFEYEYGIEWIQRYHPEAYRDFHRVLSYKERYTRIGEMQNIKRLKVNE